MPCSTDEVPSIDAMAMVGRRRGLMNGDSRELLGALCHVGSLKLEAWARLDEVGKKGG